MTYREPQLPEKRPSRAARPDPRAELDGANRALFDALRRWRNDRAKRDGRPAYVLFTNKQLAAIARTRPSSAAALREIEGVGEARARDYAAEVLAVIEGLPVEAQESADERDA